ncbi:MAG: response regulator, partial [Prolixibacteraceae bacterium]|nr:response regulator [Prolixibacteraceae bacterium]
LIQISDQHITFISSNEGLSDNKVTTIFEDSNQNFWIGTRNGGLNLFDGQSFSSITTSEELVSNSIRSVSEDRNNNLWIGTEIGLNLIKNISAEKIRNIQDWKANLKVLNFGIPDGLTSTEFYLNSNLTDSKNNIWFGTGKSLACLNLNNFRIPDIKPTIQLNRIEINEQFYDFQNINSENRKKFQNVIPFSNYPGSLKLTNHENHLTFYFSAFDPNPLNQVKYSYKIEDLNKEWSIPSTEDKADYRTLPFGNHIFMVRAIGKSQIWSDPIVYYFSISPPWWNTTYAKIAYALILISLFIGLIRLRTNNLHKKQIQLKKQIDERNQQVIKATESDRLKSAFLATMSHEIRTPLNAIIGFSELININMPVEEIVNFSQIINSSGIHLLSIVEDIFDISLIESGQIKLTIENVNLKIIYESVYSIIQEEKKRINKENIEVRLVYPENKDLHVESDLSKLKQILINLLKNALKYTEKGYIEFGYKIENPNGKPYILCYVKDTGIGIPENKKDLIFEIFRQVDDSNTRAYGGVGIGLSISKKLTEILGGKIWVESEINKGSTFFFTIPLNSNVIIVEPTENIVEKNKTLQDITILIAEDDFISYNFLKIILERYGINTVLAKNGREAVEICSEDPTIELVLMDLNMPEMNGYLATEEIKKIRPGLPIIAQTAYAIKGDLQKALDAGCDDYISKPTKRELLIEKIKKSLNIMDEPENW